MKKILVIGNLGYIGPVFGRHMCANRDEYELIGYDSGLFQGALINPSVVDDRFYREQIFGDVRKFEEKFLKGIDSIIYLAAISNDPMGAEYEEPTYEINTIAAISIAQSAKKYGVKSFIYASSCSIYGAGGEEAKNETSILNPLTAYAKSKIEAEKALQNIADVNFSITAMRFATACGPSSRLRLDLVLNDFVASAVVHKKIDILSDGTPFRPLIDTRDMAKAIEWAIMREDNAPPFLAINVGSEIANFKVIEIAESVKKLIQDVEININANAQPDKRSYKVDFNLYKALAPQHQPKFTIEETTIDLIKQIKEVNFDLSMHRESSLIRLMMLKNHRKNDRINRSLFWT